MGFKTFFSKQACRPTGVFGRWCASRIFDKKNLPLNDVMYAALAAEGNQRLLELGFGTGSLIRRIAESTELVVVQGVDFSRQMFAVAGKRNKRFVEQGRVVLQLGDFEELAYESDCFDAVYCVNTVYFWNHPQKMVQKIYGMLKPGGRLLIGYYDRADMENMSLSKNIFQLYSAAEMRALFETAFPPDAVSLVTHRGTDKPCQCAVGVKQA